MAAATAMPKKPGVGIHVLDDLTTKEQRAYDALTEKEKYELRRRPWKDKGMQGDKSHPYVENIQWKPTVHSVEWHMSGFSGEPLHKPRQKYCTRHSKPYHGDFARSLDIPMEPALARRLAQEKAIADELIPKANYKEGARVRTLAAQEEEEKKKLLIHPSFCGGSTFSR